jgi:hypothetical protein
MVALAQQWYAEPAPLPDNGVFMLPDADVAASALVQLEVDERGYARAEIAEANGELPRAAQRLPGLIRRTRFRPALAGGQPQAWSTANWRFLAWD